MCLRESVYFPTLFTHATCNILYNNMIVYVMSSESYVSLPPGALSETAVESAYIGQRSISTIIDWLVFFSLYEVYYYSKK